MDDFLNSNCTNCTNETGRAPSMLGFNQQMVLQYILHVYVLPLIVFVGLFGNFTSIYLIVIDKQMRNVSSSVYLTSVLAADTGMLLCLFLVWLESLGYPYNHVPAVCRINVYMTYVFGFLSIWYVVCITVETFITICHPTKIKQMCTLFRARVVTLVLLVTALVLYVIAPIINKVQPQYLPDRNRTINLCQPIIAQYSEHVVILSYIDTVLTLLVPLIVLIILLALMTLAIMQSIQRKQKRSTVKMNNNGQNGHHAHNRKLPQVRVAKMLYILSLSVVILNAPSHGFRLTSIFTGTYHLGGLSGFIHLILLFVSYASFSVKFFICVACSKNFRKLFFLHCCCGKVGRYRSVPQQTMETQAP